jgi:hypothetical protein
MTVETAILGLPEPVARLVRNTDKGEPVTMLDHALRWAERGLYVFPCERFLGRPIPSKWHSAATDDPFKIMEQWDANPTADIGAVPAKSDHFVIVVTGDEGRASLAALEVEHGPFRPEFSYANRWGDRHLWFPGSAFTSHHRLGRGLHVLGRGQFVYLSPSLAPDPHWREFNRD